MDEELPATWVACERHKHIDSGNKEKPGTYRDKMLFGINIIKT